MAGAAVGSSVSSHLCMAEQTHGTGHSTPLNLIVMPKKKQDEIIAEVWRNRDRLAETYGYDLDAIVKAMQEREHQPLTAICKKPNRRIEPTAYRRG